MQFHPNELSESIVNKKSTVNIQYNDFLVDSIFYNNFIKISNKNQSFISREGKKQITINENGFRSPTFKKNQDYLFSGCSITYGVGLDIEDVWYEKLINKVGGEYASVAESGDSVVGQILKIFAYIKEFGNPKNIICLFPNFDRFLMYSNKNLLASKQFFKQYSEQEYNDITKSKMMDEKKNNYLSNLFKNSALINDSYNRSKYFKAPLLAEDIITSEISHMYSAQLINILSQYCNSAGINFIWSTWDAPSSEIINSIKNDLYFKEYIDLDLLQWNRNFINQTDLFKPNQLNEKFCHFEFSDHPEFHFASDRENGIEHSHHGVHRHIHYFESFLSKIEDAK